MSRTTRPRRSASMAAPSSRASAPIARQRRQAPDPPHRLGATRPSARNFAKTMLRLAAERRRRCACRRPARPPDQRADSRRRHRDWPSLRIAEDRPIPPGIYHLTAAGETSWHGFAPLRRRSARWRAAPRSRRGRSHRRVPSTAYRHRRPAARPTRGSRHAEAAARASASRRPPGSDDAARHRSTRSCRRGAHDPARASSSPAAPARGSIR